MEDDEERPCYDRGNGSPFCSPAPTDLWQSSTQHRFVWNYNYPFYVTSEYLSLYLYYKENYAYQPIKNWTSIRRADGALAVQVDNSWFPANTTRTALYGFYLPAGLDPLAELSNPESQYPRPFNFTVVRPAPGSQGDGGGSLTGASSALPGWAIALITILGVAAAAAAALVLACCIRRRRRREQCQQQGMYAVAPDGGMYDPQQHPPTMRTVTDTSSSIYSTTPMMQAAMAAASSSPRESNGNLSSRRSSNAMPPPTGAFKGAVSHSTLSLAHDDPHAISASSSSRLADSTFMWMLDSQNEQQQQQQQQPVVSDEQRRRQLGEALLAQQLSEEKGASVKHAEKRPITVNGIRSEESRAVLEEL